MERLNTLEKETRISYINTYVLNECEASGINLELLILLEKFYNNDNSFLYDYINIGKRNEVNIQALTRKGFIITKNLWFEISLKGKELYERCLLASTGIDTSTIQSNEDLLDSQFKEWYKLYPATSKWEYNGKEFSGSRVLKQFQNKCKETYLDILNQNEYSHQDMINGLKYELKMRKEDSIKTGDNKLNYMKGALPSLNAGIYKSYIEAYKNNPSYLDNDKFVNRKNEGVVDL